MGAATGLQSQSLRQFVRSIQAKFAALPAGSHAEQTDQGLGDSKSFAGLGHLDALRSSLL